MISNRIIYDKRTQLIEHLNPYKEDPTRIIFPYYLPKKKNNKTNLVPVDGQFAIN